TRNSWRYSEEEQRSRRRRDATEFGDGLRIRDTSTPPRRPAAARGTPAWTDPCTSLPLGSGTLARPLAFSAPARQRHPDLDPHAPLAMQHELPAARAHTLSDADQARAGRGEGPLRDAVEGGLQSAGRRSGRPSLIKLIAIWWCWPNVSSSVSSDGTSRACPAPRAAGVARARAWR